nr:late protein H7 [Wadden Sea poxvirus]
MDKRLKILSITTFSGQISTKDIMALKIFLFNKRPLRTLFSITDKNDLIIDFDYGNCLASNYIDYNLYKLESSEYKKYASDIAKELTLYDIICEDVNEYINSSQKLKRLIKRYRNFSKYNNISDEEKKLNIAKSKGIDYDYIKDVL